MENYYCVSTKAYTPPITLYAPFTLFIANAITEGNTGHYIILYLAIPE
jgi:hypothetical protein